MFWQGCGANGRKVSRCLWACKLAQERWKIVWWHLLDLPICTINNLVIPHLDIYSTEMSRVYQRTYKECS